jgi:hypothetical protein
MPLIVLVCPHCKETFETSKPKKFCTKMCYLASDEFKQRIAKNMAAGREKGVGKKGQRLHSYQKCAECPTPIYMDKAAIKGNKKTCSRLCYRKYMANRFDRHIGHIESIKELSNYDEFLSQPVLSCLIEGCNWMGHNLSLHMNLSHAIKEEEFKRAAGFNLTSGIVSATMQANLVRRGNRGGMVNGEAARAARKFDYFSRESSEHRSKAGLLRNRNFKGCFEPLDD